MKGRIELTIGPMFAGKTSWLIKNINKFDKYQKLLIKYNKDTRYESQYIVTHNGKKIIANPTKNSRGVLRLAERNPNLKILGIDELQFFDSNISEVFKKLRSKGITIFASGLNVDHNNQIWDAIKSTSQIADTINNLVAVCARCGKKNATITRRKAKHRERIVIGGSELYEPLCPEDYAKVTSLLSDSLS